MLISLKSCSLTLLDHTIHLQFFYCLGIQFIFKTSLSEIHIPTFLSLEKTLCGAV